MPPPKQKPTAPSLPFDSACAFSQLAAATKSSIIFGPSTVAERRRALLVVARIAADRGQAVGREGDEVGDGEAARDVLDVGIQPAVLVDDEHRRQLAAALAGRAK